MRSVILATGLFAVLSLSACDSSKPDTTTAAATPVALKYFGRSQQMYAGQEMIDKIDTASIKPGKAGTLDMDAVGSSAAAGYKNTGFLPRINPAIPKDGIYEFDVVGDKPAGAAAVATPIDVKGAWDHYPADHVKGVKFISKTNSVVAMLPSG